jgi:hypothetical protein
MKQRLLLVTLTAIAIAISLTGFTTSLATIATPSLGPNTTAGNITDGNSTEVLAPSEEGGWG